MSIINDALKKTQQNFEHRKRILAPGSGTEKTTGKFSEITGAIIIASFMASLLVFTLAFFFAPKEKKVILPATPEDKDITTASFTPPASSAGPLSAPKIIAKDPGLKNQVAGLTLNGIVQMGEGYVALINNRILKEGDRIDNKKILGIYSDHVKVFYDGDVVILRREKF